MPGYVALFRGINVGKAKRIAMADLRETLAGLGYQDVRTLLNSGNAVFTAKTQSPARMAERIRTAVAAERGVDAVVVVKSAAEIAAIVRENVLAMTATDDSRLLVGMSQGDSISPALRKLARGDWGNERAHAGAHAVYLWCANGILESKAVESLFRELGAGGTSRNWGTLKKIHALLEA